MMKISRFGKKIATSSGIGRLMDDLASALAKTNDYLMLGGGNPAHIPKVQQHFRKSIVKLLDSAGEFEKTIGNYDPPQGNTKFIRAVAELLSKEFGWNIKEKNIALTNGSQSAFFILFNIFAGPFEDGTSRKILFPLAPEYIGYCDVGLTNDLFVANKPQIKHIDDRIFKYYINFDRLKITDRIGAICVSRPTNPTGNCLTDSEIEKLSDLARANDIPLIIDNAYGTPFPNIIFTEAKPIWNENTILCMSLSKARCPHRYRCRKPTGYKDGLTGKCRYDPRPRQHGHRHRNGPCPNRPHYQNKPGHHQTLLSEKSRARPKTNLRTI
jgi:valine--pyruvate aminotransferase